MPLKPTVKVVNPDNHLHRVAGLRDLAAAHRPVAASRRLPAARLRPAVSIISVVVRVLVVGDDVLARAGILALLSTRPEIAVVGQTTPRPIEGLLNQADVVLWDAGSAGGELNTEAIEDTASPVLALVDGERQAATLLAAGARGVLPRDAGGPRIAAAITSLSEGLLVVDEAFAPVLVRPRASSEPLIEPLTPRELEALGLIAEGLTNKAIARRLGISESTAKFHVAAILGKLGVENRSEAIVHAIRLGLVVL